MASAQNGEGGGAGRTGARSALAYGLSSHFAHRGPSSSLALNPDACDSKM